MMLNVILQPSVLSIFTTDAETLTMMWQTVVLGMLMVFSVLATLWLVLTLFKVIFAGKGSKPAKKEASAVVAKTENRPVVTTDKNVNPVVDINAVSEDILAVITAAVAAYMSEESGTEVSTSGFRVVSFRRASNGRSWNAK